MTDLKVEDFILKLCAENRTRLRPDWKEPAGTDYYNTVFLEASGIPFDFLAFHVGPLNQQLLTPAGLGEACGKLNFGHVFFSTAIDDLKFYLNQDQETMTYFTDLRRVGEARVQTTYKSKVLFQDDLCKILDEHKKGRVLLEEVEEVIEDWMRKYTVPFNLERIPAYKKAGNYVLIRAPIKVNRYP